MCRVEDALHRRHYYREHPDVENQQGEAGEQALDAAHDDGRKPETKGRQHQHERNRAETEAADNFFAPGIAEELQRTLDGGEV